MKNLDEEQGLIRSYLLGEATPEEQESLERRVMLDGEFREMVSLVEEELVEDFLRGHLPERYREKFAEHFLTTPQQAAKVRVLGALHRYGAEAQHATQTQTTEATEAKEPQGNEDADSAAPFWRKLLPGRAWSPAYGLAAAALIIVALAVGFMLLKSRRDGEGRERVEQELARLNDPNAPAPPADPRTTLTVALSPILVRDVARAERINLTHETAVVSLRLLTTGNNYQSYQAALRVTGGQELFVVRNLRPTAAGAEQHIVVHVPARLLTRGDYQLELSGVAADGRTSALGDYSFRVAGP